MDGAMSVRFKIPCPTYHILPESIREVNRMERKRKKVNRGINMMNFWSATIAKDKKRKKNGNKGFSLVELIIVIAIMSILAAAIAPAIIRYIDKSRKAVDIETAQCIFEAANLASCSWDDDINQGWGIAITAGVACETVNSNGHRHDKDPSDGNTYKIYPVAWARGVKKGNWENSVFKSTLDKGDNGNKQRAFTDEFLKNLYHRDGVGQTYNGVNGTNAYDGEKDQLCMEFRFKKNAGQGDPECWILYIRGDNYKPEVWIGDKNFNGRGSGQPVKPLYRMYPDPCSDYK